MPAATRPCPACARPRPVGHYLCWRCWHTLPAATRRHLTERCPDAAHRLRQLYEQIGRATPLTDIHIEPADVGGGGDPCAS
jgi:hypothetical protein